MDERVCSIALTLCDGIGVIGAKTLIESVGSASEIFELRDSLRDVLPDISPKLIAALDNKEALEHAEREIAFAEQKGIQCLTLNDTRYPTRLKNCPDAPPILFFKGHADLNRQHIVSIVGTRRCTEYGKSFCQKFVHELSEACPDVIIVSGLAYGIDVQAHRAALSRNLSTIGVLAHGLDRIYPSLHRQTAIQMLERGGLLTEYVTGTEPARQNFLIRNRIVAGISDATIVVESFYKGGSLSTANLALNYNRTCFALPGRINDLSSEGCNRLIARNKAILLTSVDDFLEELKWDKAIDRKTNAQGELFLELNPEEQQIVDILSQEPEPLHINLLASLLEQPIHRVSSLLLELEMKGVVKPLAGSLYKIV